MYKHLYIYSYMYMYLYTYLYIYLCIQLLPEWGRGNMFCSRGLRDIGSSRRSSHVATGDDTQRAATTNSSPSRQLGRDPSA